MRSKGAGIKYIVGFRITVKILFIFLIIHGLLFWNPGLSSSWRFSQPWVPQTAPLKVFLGPSPAAAATPVAIAGNDRTIIKDQPLAGTVVLEGFNSYDPDDDPLTFIWYGPFATTFGSEPGVEIPAGTYTASLVVDDGSSCSAADTVVFTVSPCFSIATRCKRGKVQLTWSHVEGTERYDVYRADAADPSNFIKIGETTSTYSTYLDITVQNENTYLYVVGALNREEWCFSEVASSHPTAVRSRTPINYSPVIYSTPIENGNVGIIYNYDVNATDPNRDGITYALSTSPLGMTINPVTGLIAWIPDTVGFFPVILDVSDGMEKCSQEFTIVVTDTDSDNDGTPDCLDNCPDDPAKTEPGVCGCGTADTDSDNDGVADCIDSCPGTLSGDSVDENGCSTAQNIVYVEVPNVGLQSEADAVSSLAAAALAVEKIVYVNHATVPLGYVLAQNPGGGTLVEEGTGVTLYLSEGPRPVENLPEGSFGGTYKDLIPADAEPDIYELVRFAIVTGLVHDGDGNALPGVTITVLNHPEYGTTLSNDSGRFLLPVNGGGLITIRYAKDGFIRAQRSVMTPWNDFVNTEIVALLPWDTQVTTLEFDGNPATPLVHVGSTINDGDGSREAVVVFSGDTTATAVAADGSTTLMTGPLTVRATEFPSPESMPAILPPTSGFTYCVELSIDEAGDAARVEFSQPVLVFLRNFIGFDVGMVVPVGSYDRSSAQWIPENDGMVVRLLDTDANGAIDALDVDGDDIADDLDEDGDFADEVFGVEASGQYVPGDTVWRVATTHFTPIDFNWGASISPDAIYPNPSNNPNVDKSSLDDPCFEAVGSKVDPRGQTLHEDLPLPGTNASLHYASNRVSDYHYTFFIPASGDTVPDSLDLIAVEVEVAGRIFRQELLPLPNQNAELVWDGLDVLGNPINYVAEAEIRIGFAYPPYYNALTEDLANTYNLVNTFGVPGNIATPYQGRSYRWSGAYLWTTHRLTIPVATQATRTDGLGHGWTLRHHHNLINGSVPLLLRGDGTMRRVSEKQDLIWTIAGNGSAGFGGDGGPATESELNSPVDIAVAADGILYIADRDNRRIRRIDKDGNISTVAGTGGANPNNLNENGAATGSDLYNLRALSIGPEGNLFIVVGGPTSDLVRRIDPNGIITTVAGLNADPFAECLINQTASPGDGGPAIDARLCDVNDIEVGSDGSIYIAQGRLINNKLIGDVVIRKISPDKRIQTIAGQGPEAGSNTQIDSGMQAYEARFAVPTGLSLDARGNLLIADRMNGVIRSLGGDGILRTVGGQTSGTGTPPADGDLATAGPWGYAVQDVLAAADGGYYALCDIGHFCNHIRRVDPEGRVHQFAGRWPNDWVGYSGDRGPVLGAQFAAYGIGKMALSPDGYIYLADTHNHVIRKIGPAVSAIDPGVDPVTEILIPECSGCPGYGGQGHVFDKGGKHLRTIDLATGTVLTTFAYDGNDRLLSVIDRFGNITTIQRDSSGQALSITGPFGDVTNLVIDDNGVLARVVYADGSGYNLGYTSQLLTSKIDPVGEEFSYSYDAKGRFTANEDPAGGGMTVASSMSADSRMTSVLTSTEGRTTTYVDLLEPSDRFVSEISGPDGSVDTYRLDANRFGSQRLEADGIAIAQKLIPDSLTAVPFVGEQSVTTPGGLTRTVSVDRSYGVDGDLDGRPDTVSVFSNINGRIQTYVQDLSARTITFTSPLLRNVMRTYDPTTLLTKRLSVNGLDDVDYFYDVNGRLSRTVQGSRQTDYTYSGAFFESVTNALSQTTTYHRDDLGRVSGLTLADSSYWDIERDANGRLSILAEPDTLTEHRFSYTPMGLLESYTSPLGAVENFLYDRDGLLTQRCYPSGDTIDWQYNVKRQLTTIQTPEGAHSFSYDVVTGQLERADSRDGQQVEYVYDGSLTTQSAWSGVVTGTISMAYDDALRISQFNYAGLSLPLSWDDDDLLTGVGSIAIVRDSGNGLVTEISDGSFGIVFTNNVYGEIATISATHGATLYDVATTYDDLGRIIQKTETIGGSTHTWTYDYDTVGQLIQVARDSIVVEAYDYDAAGNRIAINNTFTGMSLGSGDFSYDADNKLLAAGTTTYGYDADGRLHQMIQGSDTTTYVYNTDGTLLSVGLPDGRQLTYQYDHRGRRISRSDNGLTTHFWLYGEGLMPVAEYDGSGILSRAFVYAGGPVPVAYVQGGSTYHIVADHLGSPRLVVNDTGTVVKQVDYDAFGNVIADSNPELYLCFGFAGGMADPDHQLIRFGVRDYQPSAGRWTAKDPILFMGGWNLYGYVQNDPLNQTDRTGFQVVSVFGSDDQSVERHPFDNEALEELYVTCTPESKNPRCVYICSQLREKCEENRTGKPLIRWLHNCDEEQNIRTSRKKELDTAITNPFGAGDFVGVKM